MKNKKLLAVFATGVMAVNLGVASLAFAQQNEDQTASQTINCGTDPVLSGQTDLVFGSVNIADTEQNTSDTNDGIEITDNRSPSCSANPVVLTLQMTENFCVDKVDTTDGPSTALTTDPDCDGTEPGFVDIPLIAGGDTDNVIEAGETAADLRFSHAAATCTSCSYYNNSTAVTNSQLSEATGGTAFATPNAAVTMFSNTTPFAGVAAFPTVTFNLDIPAFPPAGAFESTILYTLTY